MKKVKVKIEGLTPILMHNPASMKGSKIGPKEIPTPEDEAELATYRLSDKTLYVPTIAVRSSIIAGASPFKVGKQSLKTILSGIIQAMEPEECLPIMRKGKELKEYDEIDIRRAVIQGQGILRARPKINLPWLLQFVMCLDDTIFSVKQFPVLEDVINRAGAVVGILDFRPGSPKNKTGWFGKYKVNKFEIIEKY